MSDAVSMPVISANDDGLYVVMEPWSVAVDVNGARHVLTVGKGFVFDGASIPRALWSVCGHPYEAPRCAAALAHDWLYSSHAVDRGVADGIYLELERRVGVPWYKRYSEYLAVRMFGWAPWKAGKREIASALSHGSLVMKENA